MTAEQVVFVTTLLAAAVSAGAAVGWWKDRQDWAREHARLNHLLFEATVRARRHRNRRARTLGRLRTLRRILRGGVR